MGFFTRRSKKYTRVEESASEDEEIEDEVPFLALEVSDRKDATPEIDNSKSSAKGKQLRTAALVVSWISVVFAFLTGVAAIALGQVYDSESLFGYGLDAVLDSFSSIAVLWRFYGSATSVQAEARERKACIVISIFFFASAFSLTFKSARAIAKDDREEEEGRILTDAFSSFCGVVALILATMKVYLGRRLDSRSLITDSIITYVGAAMSFLGVLGLELYRSDDSVWYLDAVFGLCCGVFLFFFGLKLLIQMTCLYNRKEPLIDEETTKE